MSMVVMVMMMVVNVLFGLLSTVTRFQLYCSLLSCRSRRNSETHLARFQSSISWPILTSFELFLSNLIYNLKADLYLIDL